MQRSWLLAFGEIATPGVRVRRVQPVQIARMKYSFTTVSLPANDDGNETKKGGREREGNKGVDRRLPAYLFVYRGNRGWFGVDKRWI